MRSPFALVFGLGLAVVAACSHAKAPDCSKVTVRPVGAPSFELPTALEYCLYTPDAAACCRDGGSRCDQIASPAGFGMSSIDRAPGCPAR